MVLANFWRPQDQALKGNTAIFGHQELSSTACPSRIMEMRDTVVDMVNNPDKYAFLTAPKEVTPRERVDALYMEILERHVDEGAVAGRTQQTEDQIRAALLASDEYKQLQARKAEEAAKAEADRIAAEKAAQEAKDKAEQEAKEETPTATETPQEEPADTAVNTTTLFDEINKWLTIFINWLKSWRKDK
jgi:hypothetical protein